jgi:hypothetical protein
VVPGLNPEQGQIYPAVLQSPLSPRELSLLYFIEPKEVTFVGIFNISRKKKTHFACLNLFAHWFQCKKVILVTLCLGAESGVYTYLLA